jgi:hypothetical protein
MIWTDIILPALAVTGGCDLVSVIPKLGVIHFNKRPSQEQPLTKTLPNI